MKRRSTSALLPQLAQLLGQEGRRRRAPRHNHRHRHARPALRRANWSHQRRHSGAPEVVDCSGSPASSRTLSAIDLPEPDKPLIRIMSHVAKE